MATNKLKLKQIDPDIQAYVDAIGDGIIESGSNSNGRWIKFRDGTMIQYGIIPSCVPNIGGGSKYYIPVTCYLPTSFAGTYYIGSAGGVGAYAITDGLHAFYTDAFNIFVQNDAVSTVSEGRYITVGRWK